MASLVLTDFVLLFSVEYWVESRIELCEFV